MFPNMFRHWDRLFVYRVCVFMSVCVCVCLSASWCSQPCFVEWFSGTGCRRLSAGESCLVSSDGVRDSAGYGHRSVVWYGLLWYGMVWASLHPPPPCRCRSTPRKCTAAEHDFIDTARQQIVALHGIPAAGVTRLLAIVSIPAASGRRLCCPLWVKAREELTCRQNRWGRIHTLGRAVARGWSSFLRNGIS